VILTLSNKSRGVEGIYFPNIRDSAADFVYESNLNSMEIKSVVAKVLKNISIYGLNLSCSENSISWLKANNRSELCIANVSTRLLSTDFITLTIYTKNYINVYINWSEIGFISAFIFGILVFIIVLLTMVHYIVYRDNDLFKRMSINLSMLMFFSLILNVIGLFFLFGPREDTFRCNVSYWIISCSSGLSFSLLSAKELLLLYIKKKIAASQKGGNNTQYVDHFLPSSNYDYFNHSCCLYNHRPVSAQR